MKPLAAGRSGDLRKESFDLDAALDYHFCCCEFIDRHGRQVHLADASAFDAAAQTGSVCSSEGLQTLLYDLDDRIRLPMHGGALHLGVCGLVPLFAVPALALLARRSARCLLGVAICTPVILATSAYFERCIGRRFFQVWCGCSLVLQHAVFTLSLGEHIPFAAWLLASVALLGAVVSVHVAAYGEAGEAGEAAELAPLREDAGELGSVVWLGFGVTPRNRPAVEGALAACAVASGITAALALRRSAQLHHSASLFQLARVVWAGNESSVELVLGVGAALVCLHALRLFVWQRIQRALDARRGGVPASRHCYEQ
jgi:hypothetical protein